jgi:3-hydroxybutyryl-CoA dehydratase
MAQQRIALAVGDTLPVVSRRITQEQLHCYAEASGDHNPLHVNPEFAGKTPFGGTIAHGMLVLAFVSEMLTAAFGRAWLESGRLKIRFRAPAKPGDEVNVLGNVVKMNGSRIICEIECKSGAGEVLVSGEAEVIVE